MRGDRYFEEILVCTLVALAGAPCAGRGPGSFLFWIGCPLVLLGTIGIVVYEYKRSRS
jgi:hypothetical protein